MQARQDAARPVAVAVDLAEERVPYGVHEARLAAHVVAVDDGHALCRELECGALGVWPEPLDLDAAKGEHQSFAFLVFEFAVLVGRWLRLLNLADTALNRCGHGRVDGAHRRFAVPGEPGFRIHDGLEQLGVEVWVELVPAR